MAIKTDTYMLECDKCRQIFRPLSIDDNATIYRVRAAAKRAGWARRNMGAWVPEYQHPTYGKVGGFQSSGPYRDFCPDCLDRLDKEASDGK